MALFDRLSKWRTRSTRPAGEGFASPFSEPPAGKATMPSLDPLALPVTRDEAMTVPAVSRGRDLICGLGRRPVELWGPDGVKLATQPDWLSRTDGEVHPGARMKYTFDDALFYGLAIWGVTRAQTYDQGLVDRAGNPIGDITDMLRIPREWWEIDPITQEVRIDQAAGGGEWVTPDATDVCVFVSPTDPFLTMAQRTMRGAIGLERSWISAALAPSLHWAIVESAEAATRGRMSTKEIDKMRAELTAISLDPKAPGVIFVPAGYRIESLSGKADTALLTAGRNAAKVDLAGFMNVPATMEDASIANSSMTYVNAQGKTSEWTNEGAEFWTSPIEERLSMNDITAPGVTARFNLDSLYDTNAQTPEWKENA